jgi:hypothetical protein
MMRVLIAGTLAVVLLAAGCGGDAQPGGKPGGGGKGPDGGSTRKPGGGVVVIKRKELPRVLVEAEAATNLVAPFQVVADSEASGGKCLTLPSKGCGAVHQHIAPEGTPERTAGSAELAFSVDQEGEYVLWIRKWWCCSCGDSFSLQLDEGKPFVFGNDATTFRNWTWLAHQEAGEPVKFKLSAGAHKLTFKNRGESGFRIDQVLFTADPEFVPQKIVPQRRAAQTDPVRSQGPVGAASTRLPSSLGD